MALLQVTNYAAKPGEAYEVHDLEVTENTNYEDRYITRFHWTSSKGSGLWKRIRRYEKQLIADGAKTPVLFYDRVMFTENLKRYTLTDVTVYESVEESTDTYYLIFECYKEQVKERIIHDTEVSKGKPSSPRSRKPRKG